jgi:outer membrane protein OmpA-like peptidoglycan-associated protein
MDVAEGMISETKAIDDARGLMVMAADLDTSFMKANFEAGRLHILTINKDLAVKYFMRVFRQDPQYRFDIEYWIAKSYQYGLEFDKAIAYYNLYKEKLAKKSNYQGKDKVDAATIERHLYECQNGKEYVSSPGNYSIVNIGREINSEFDDYGPVLNENEDEIVFTTRRRDDNLNQNVADDNKPWEDIFYSNKKGSTWAYAKNIGVPVNTPTHDSNLALSADASTLFSYYDGGGGDIYYSDRKADGTWSQPTPLPGIINSSFEEKSVTISKDEKTLYFTSNRPGGYGGTDLYRATKDSKGEWSTVKNLGPDINTEFDEDGPFIDFDGVTLYFSSKGHKGMGGHDIFKATYDPAKNEWTKPENLGYPINTPDDDIYFIVSNDGKRAYYSSVRDDGMGYQDIYLITIPEGIKNLEPVVAKAPQVQQPKDTTTTAAVKKPTETPMVATTTPPKTDPAKVEPAKVEPAKTEPAKTQPKTEPAKTPPVAKTEPVKPKVEPKKVIKPIKYMVTIVDSEGKPLNAKVRMQGAKDNVIVSMKPQGSGVYEFAVKSDKAKDYRLTVEAEGYVFQNVNVRIEGATENDKMLDRKIEMRRLSVGVTSILRNIYFDFNKATFKTESYPELNKLEAMMRQNQNLMVEIGGHTDAVGGKPYNTYLSQRRAEAVKDYLTKKGIDARRVKAKGYGETKPLASNDDESEGREFNRRVEFQVLSN